MYIYIYISIIYLLIFLFFFSAVPRGAPLGGSLGSLGGLPWDPRGMGLWGPMGLGGPNGPRGPPARSGLVQVYALIHKKVPHPPRVLRKQTST